jgi:acetyl-CoA carboxylase biotin carboxyl carrier protein
MELEQILKLIDAVSKSALTGFSLEEGETKLTLTAERVKEFSPVQQTGEPGIQSGCMQASQAGNTADMDGYGFTVAGSEYQTDTQKNEKQAEGTVVASPLVGIFYSAPSPEDEPFVTVGDTVKKGQTLGVIEAMKLMNEIESECDGIVKEVLVENGEMVEFGQPLFIVGV